MEINFKKYLPIGSVVRLHGGKKKFMIIGMLQLDEEKEELYDYITVPYPEGFIGGETCACFNHGDIDEVICRGLDDRERQNYLKLAEDMIKGTNKWIEEHYALK